MTAVGHVLLSVALGFAIVGVGLEFSQQASSYIAEFIGAAMLVGGMYYGIRELRRNVKEDYRKAAVEGLAKGEGKLGRRFGYFAVLGAALSPDLAILPIFALATPMGIDFALATALVFGVASIAALLLFLVLGVAGLASVFERIPPRYSDALVGFVIAAVGVYVLLEG